VYQAPREKCLQNGPKSTGCETVEKYNLTYRVWNNGDWFVVDGKERATYDSVPAGPVFRADGVLEFLAANRPSLYRIEVTDF
jgi:hypothetical protein